RPERRLVPAGDEALQQLPVGQVRAVPPEPGAAEEVNHLGRYHGSPLGWHCRASTYYYPEAAISSLFFASFPGRRGPGRGFQAISRRGGCGFPVFKTGPVVAHSLTFTPVTVSRGKAYGLCGNSKPANQNLSISSGCIRLPPPRTLLSRNGASACRTNVASLRAIVSSMSCGSLEIRG